MIYTVQQESELIHLAKVFLDDHLKHKIICFKGDMGAGKTTFIKYLAKAMGVEDQVSSPTYGYVNEYFSPYYGKVIHFDLYRIDTTEEAFDIGFEEYLYNDDYVFIEWPQKIDNLLPENIVWVNITIEETGERKIEINDEYDRP